MDFPSDPPVPTHICTWMDCAGGAGARLIGGAGGTSSQSWPSINLAVFTPLWLSWPYTAQRVFWVNGGTISGNVDMGIYTPGGARIWSAGSTVQSGATTLQYVGTGGLRLAPGPYYLALTFSATSGHVTGSGLNSVTSARLAGLVQMASALPLPATATFATSTTNLWPLMGLTTTASGF